VAEEVLVSGDLVFRLSVDQLIEWGNADPYAPPRRGRWHLARMQTDRARGRARCRTHACAARGPPGGNITEL